MTRPSTAASRRSGRAEWFRDSDRSLPLVALVLVMAVLAMLSGATDAVAAAQPSLDQAAVYFALGSLDAAEKELRSVLATNPSASDLDRALELLTEIRVEREREAAEASKNKSAGKLPLERGFTPVVAAPRVSSTPQPASAPMLSRWERSFPGAPDKFRQDNAVYAITALGEGYVTTVRIHRAGNTSFSQQRLDNLFVIDLPEVEDKLPQGGLDLPQGGATKIRHSQHSAEPKVARVAVQLKSAKTKVSVTSGAEEIVLSIEDESTEPARPTAGTYRPPAETERYRIEISGGNFQRGYVADRTPQPLSVRVVDPATGAGIAQVPVQFQCVEAGVRFSDPLTMTAEAGIAVTNVMLDQVSGRKIISARIPQTAAEVSFELYAVPRSADSVRKVSGEDAVVRSRQASSTPLVASVQDEYGNPVPGVKVRWDYVDGAGTVDADPDAPGNQNLVETDEKGLALLKNWTAGPIAGTQRVQASFTQGNSTRFTQFELNVQPQLVSMDFFQTPVADILRFLGRIASWNLVLSDGVEKLAEPNATVHLENVPIDDALDKILSMKSLTRIEQSDGSIKIVTFSEAQSKGQAVITDPRVLDQLPQDVVKTVMLDIPGANFAGIVAAVTPLLTPEGRVISDPASRKVVVTDYVSTIRRMRDVLSEFANADNWRILSFKNLQLGSKTVEDLIKTQIPTEMKYFFNGKTGIFIGGEAAINRIESILQAMDENDGLLAAEEEAGKRYEIIPLRQQKATELEGILLKVFTTKAARDFLTSVSLKEETVKEEAKDKDAKKDKKEEKTSSKDDTIIGKAFGQTVDEVRIVAEPKTNTLILFGLAGDLQIVKQVIQQLDSIELQKETLTANDVRIIQIKFRKVDEVLRSLNEILFPENKKTAEEVRRTGYWWDYWYNNVSASQQVGSILTAQGQMRKDTDEEAIPLRLSTIPEPNLLVIVGGKEKERDLIEKLIEEIDQLILTSEMEYLKVYKLEHMLPSEFQKFIEETEFTENNVTGGNFSWIDCIYFGINCDGYYGRRGRQDDGRLKSFPIDEMRILVVKARRVKHTQLEELLKMADNPEYERRLDLIVKRYEITKGDIQSIAEIINRNALNLDGTTGEFLFIEDNKIVVWAKQGAHLKIERLVPQFDQPELKFDPELKYSIYEFKNISVTEVIGATTQAEREIVDVASGMIGGGGSVRSQNKTILELISEPIGDDKKGRGVYPSVTGNFILIWGPTGAVDRAIAIAKQIDSRWDKARISLEVYNIHQGDPQTVMNFIKGTIFGEDNKGADAGGEQVKTQSTEFMIPSATDPRTIFVWALPATHDRINTFMPIIDTGAFSYTNHKVFRVPGLRFAQARDLAKAVSPNIRLFDMEDLWLAIGDLGGIQRLQQVMSAVTPSRDSEVALYEIIKVVNRPAKDVRDALVELLGLGPEGAAALSDVGTFGGERTNVKLSITLILDANTLVVTGGSKAQRDLALTLAKEIDEMPFGGTAGDDWIIRLYSTKHILPTEMTKFLITVLTRTTKTVSQSTTATGAESERETEKTTEDAKLIPLDSLKLIVVRAARPRHQEIAEAINMIDKPDFANKMELGTRAYEVKEASLNVLADILRQRFLNQAMGEFLLIDAKNKRLVVWAYEAALTKIDRILPVFDKADLSYDPAYSFDSYVFRWAPFHMVNQALDLDAEVLKILTSGGDDGRVVYSAADRSGNMMLMWGRKDKMERAKDYLIRLDEAIRDNVGGETNVRIVDVKNRPATEVFAELNQFWGLRQNMALLTRPETPRNAIVLFLPPDLVDQVIATITTLDTSMPIRILTARNLQVDPDLRALVTEVFPDLRVIPMGAGANASRLLVQGSKERLEELEKVWAEADTDVPVRYFHLLNTDVTILSTQLQTMFPDVLLTSVGNNQIIVAKGAKGMLDQVAVAIDALDTMNVRLIEILHADDDALADILRSSAFPGLYIEYQHQGPSHTFMVIRAGNQKVLNQALEFIKQMDNIDVHLVRLQHIDPDEMMSLISLAYQDLSTSISVVPSLNSLAFIATPEKAKIVKNLIARFDTPQKLRVLKYGRLSMTDAQTLLMAFFPALNSPNMLQTIGTPPSILVAKGADETLDAAEALLQQLDAGLMWRTYPLSRVSYDEVTAALTNLFGQVQTAQLPNGNGIGILATEPRMAEVVAFLRKIEGNEIVFIPIENALAADVASAITKFFPDLATNSVQIVGRSLLVSADGPVVESIRDFVKALDRDIHTAIRPMKHYSKERQTQIQTVVGTLSFKPTVFQWEDQTNSFIVQGSLSSVQKTLELIDAYDRPPLQFYIEAAVLEVNISGQKDLGIDWRYLPDLAAFAIDAATISFTSPVIGNPQATLIKNDHTGAPVLTAVINAIASATDARVVTTPKLTTGNNQKATATVGENYPYTTPCPQTNVNQIPGTCIDFYPVDQILTVTPSGTFGSDNIMLDLDVNINSVQGFTASGAPQTAGRHIETKVQVKDGEILILSGFIRKNDIVSTTKVPILGDIPGLGNIFKSTERREGTFELLVIVQPRILYAGSQELQQEEELNRYKYLVNFPADWTGRKWLINNPQTRGEYARKQIEGAKYWVQPPAPEKSGTVIPDAASSSTSSAVSPISAARIPILGSMESLDINIATAADLKGIPGMPPHIAELIVRYRESYGQFGSVGDIIKVPGVSNDIYDKVSPYLRTAQYVAPFSEKTTPAIQHKPLIQPVSSEAAQTPAPVRTEPAPAPSPQTSALGPGVAPSPAEIAMNAPVRGEEALSRKININTASLDQLMLLSGFRENHARMIIAYRNTYGAFRTVDELLDVPGITPELFAKNRNVITTTDEPSAAAPTPSTPQAAPKPPPVQQPPAPQPPAPNLQTPNLINLNTASEAELAQIKEFSTQNVKLILAYRSSYGAYKSLEDLLDVPSITKDLLDKVRARLTVK